MRMPAAGGGGKKLISLDEFDEEINGINLSKLFSAYGPSNKVVAAAMHAKQEE